jgi:osmotically-inducible protein OsmY
MRKMNFPIEFAIGTWAKCSMCALLLFSSLLFARPAPQASRNTNTDANAPNTKPLRDHMSNKDVTEKLQKALDNKNPQYKGSNIQTAVDDQSITLSGTVTSDMQREWAMQFARAYAGNRKIVDKLTVSQ